MATNPDCSDLLSALSAEGAEFLVVGAHAVMFHSGPRFTKHLDPWVRPIRDNAGRVLRALATFGAPLSDLTVDDLAVAGTIFEIGVAPNRIDVLTSIDAVDFDAAWSRRVPASHGAQPMAVLGVEDLVANKCAAARPKDLLDVATLRRARVPSDGSFDRASCLDASGGCGYHRCTPTNAASRRAPGATRRVMIEAGPVLYSDRAIKCTDCGAEFTFSAGEQQFYEERGFRFPPRRCKECRLKKRDTPGNAGSRAVRTDGTSHASGEPKETWPATCTNCGATTTVPFKPDPQRPTFCRKCYAERKAAPRGR